MEVHVGETVLLMCNTSSDIMWTYDTGDGLVNYVYWNRLIDTDWPRLTVNITAANDVHSLIILQVQLNYSGLYDCYTSSGLRTVGYQLMVNRTYYLGSCCVVVSLGIFSARCNIYISHLCYDVSVRLSVTEVHWRIIANLCFKFRS